MLRESPKGAWYAEFHTPLWPRTSRPPTTALRFQWDFLSSDPGSPVSCVILGKWCEFCRSQCLLPFKMEYRTRALESDKKALNFDSDIMTDAAWSGYLVFLNLSFLICKMGVIMVSTPQSECRLNKRRQVKCLLITALRIHLFFGPTNCEVLYKCHHPLRPKQRPTLLSQCSPGYQSLSALSSLGTLLMRLFTNLFSFSHTLMCSVRSHADT